VSGEEHAQLIDARVDVVIKIRFFSCSCQFAPGELVQGHDRSIAGVIGVVHGRTIDCLRPIAHRVVIGDGDRFAVRNAEAVKWPASGVQVRTRVLAPGCIK